MDGEVTDTEYWREDGAAESASTSDSLILDQLLELLALEHTAYIDVVHDGLDVDGRLVVCGKDLLELLNTSSQAEAGLAVLHDVDLVLLVELLGKVLNQGLVDVATTEVAVPGARLDSQLTLLELDDGSGVVAVADVDEDDSPWLLLGPWEVELCDSPAESDCGVVVDEAEALEASNVGSVEDGAALGVGVPDGAAEDDVVDGEF